MQEEVLFEFPLNERTRVFIRLESMLDELYHFLEAESLWDFRSGIYALNRLLHFVERKDFRLEIIKELERIHGNLIRLVDNPGVVQKELEKNIHEVEEYLDLFRKKTKSYNASLMHDDLLSTIRLRIATANLTSPVDLPYFHSWINQPGKTRFARFAEWVHAFDALKEVITWILTSLRNSSNFSTCNADTGTFQQNLDPQQYHSIIRLKVPAGRIIFPEISGSRHRVNIRFLEYSGATSSSKPIQTKSEVDFEISVCS